MAHRSISQRSSNSLDTGRDQADGHIENLQMLNFEKVAGPCFRHLS